jgi:4-alpha-glucanotransferase
MILNRSAGVLLHITSLPGKSGIGTFGEESYNFIDLLKKSGQSYWQILPIGPVASAFGFSPYASTSAFAGNYHFICLEKIINEDWCSDEILIENIIENDFVDFDFQVKFKFDFLKKIFKLFLNNRSDLEKDKYDSFCKSEKYWLDDFALFSALSDYFDTNKWTDWDEKIAFRENMAIDSWNEKLKDEITLYKFIQYIFFKQYDDLKDYAKKNSIKLIGDIPIYIIFESADAWANPNIFLLDTETLEPLFVSGVPPDYFSSTGQRWGNPLYKWLDDNDKLNSSTFNWWMKRIKHITGLVDIVRIDHFRAFDSYWSIPVDEETAIKGKWIKGPGKLFFDKLELELGELNFIAEDLGLITKDVEKLRDDLELPGMKILQFAFDFNNDNYYLPHNIDNTNSILYTGTHDNNTTNGWFYGNETDESKREYILEYLGLENWDNFHWKLIREAYKTVASLVIIPAQDLLGYSDEFRMNTPGTVEENWRWKLKREDLSDDIIFKLKQLCNLYKR